MKVIVSACLAGDNCKYNGGKNITKEFSHGAQLAFEIVQKENPDLIILQSRSPSCGIKQIYDGTFSGTKIPGRGLFAELCIKAGYKVLDIEDFEEYLVNLRLVNLR